jgi:hypothetical protein
MNTRIGSLRCSDVCCVNLTEQAFLYAELDQAKAYALQKDRYFRQHLSEMAF